MKSEQISQLAFDPLLVNKFRFKDKTPNRNDRVMTAKSKANKSMMNKTIQSIAEKSGSAIKIRTNPPVLRLDREQMLKYHRLL